MRETCAELGEKQERLQRVAHDAGVAGILLAAHHSVAWFTGGRSNRVDGSRETGAARLLSTADGRRFVIANAIEMPRLVDEVLVGLDFEPIEFPWEEDQVDPARAVAAARGVLGADAAIGADWAIPGSIALEGELMRARSPLTEPEIARYRALGRDAGLVVGNVCRTLTPGDDERDIAATLMHALAAVRARAIVTLVGSDERLRRYRHPVATPARWQHVVMVAVCAERDGLVASLSRLVAAGRPPADLAVKTRAAASVFGRLLAATRPGATGVHLYSVAADAYRDAGFPGEERLHHQGGAIGYRAREWVAHPLSREVVRPRQAFTWNPTITGTKIEDTAIVTDDRVEIITASRDWPTIPLQTSGPALHASDIWRLN